MEAIWTNLLAMDWWMPAACDVVALLAVMGSVGLWRTRGAIPGVVHEPVRFPDTQVQVQEVAFEPESAPAAPMARADVKRALAAIGRWENHYKASRGVVELARFVETQRSSREVAAR